MRERFRVTGDVCIETNPADVDDDLAGRLREAGVTMVSLGVQSFHAQHLATIGRRYPPEAAANALARLAAGGFAGVNADLMFALPRADHRRGGRRSRACGASSARTR